MMKLQSACKRHRRVATLRPFVLALISAGCVSAALAGGNLPEFTQPSAVVGNSTVATDATGTTMTLTQTSSHAVLEANTFNIAKGYTLLNDAPANSFTLFRVIGTNGQFERSVIDGTFIAKNHVMISSPAGISVGGSAVISTGSLVMSAKDLDDTQVDGGKYTGFMETGHISFNHNPAGSYGDSTIDISPKATLTATADGGSIFLVADNVRNQGTLKAGQGGTVGLLAVPSAEFDVGDSGFITLTNYANYDPATQDVTNRVAVNTGSIDAPNGTVTMVGVGAWGEGNRFQQIDSQLGATTTADALYTSGVDGSYGSGAFNSGTITAHGGKISLIGQGPRSIAAVTGTLDVSAMAGVATMAGSISMSAETVRVGLYGAAPGELLADGPNEDPNGAIRGTIDLGDTAVRQKGDTTHTRWIYVSGDTPPITGNVDIPPLPTDGKASTLSGSATDSGNGGNITLSAMYVGPPNANRPEPLARYDYGQVEAYGNFYAQGGQSGGSGGHVVLAGQNVNAKLGTMKAQFHVTPQALGLGANGTVSVVTPYLNIGYDPQGAYGGQYAPTLGQSWIDPDMITGLLTGGTDVSMTASGNGATAFTDPVSLHVHSYTFMGSSGSGSSRLVLQSDGGIAIDLGTSITASNGSLEVQIEANGGGLSISGDPIGTDGSPVSIYTNGGNLTLTNKQPAEGAAATDKAGVYIAGADLNTTADGSQGADKIIINGTGGGTIDGVPSKNGVTIEGGSQLTGSGISINGVSDSATGVRISDTTLNSTVLGTSIYGQSQGGLAANGPAIGVDIGQGVQINMGSGSATIKGRAVASDSSPDAVGVRIAQLDLVTQPGQTGAQPQVTLIGSSVGSTAPGIQVTSSAQGQGINLHDVLGSTVASTADVIIGASATYPTATAALDLGKPAWNTTGRVNFKPMDLNEAMQAAGAVATAIRVGANAGAVATNFIVKPEWFNAAFNGNILSGPGPSFVIGSSGHTGLISVADGALDGAGIVTLQNQGALSEGIQLGTQQDFVQTLNLVTAGNITQTGPMMANTLRVIPGTDSVVTLDNPGNQINSVSYNNQPAGVAPQGVTSQATLANAASADIQSFDSGVGVFTPLSIQVAAAPNNPEVPPETPVTPVTPVSPVIPRPFEGPDALNDLRTDVYVHGQLGRPQICTAANTSGGATNTEGGVEPLALEWIKVRRSAQLSNCSGVRTDNSCSAF